MNHFDKILSCFPAEVRSQLAAFDSIEEIRVYRNRGVQVFAGRQSIAVNGILDGGDMHNLLNNLMKYSYYAYEEDIAKGFITIDGGHRVGICGKAVMEQGKVTLLRDISSLNIRCSREIVGCAEGLKPYIWDTEGHLQNLLIISPPGCGKTTLLRDLARIIGIRGHKVAICDERSEIAGVHNGVSPYTFGPMTDILDGCPKGEGMVMLLRAMSPEVIFTDEIGRKADAEAIKSCRNSGVAVIASAHGDSLEDLKRMEIYSLIESRTFDVMVFLSHQPKAGTIREVCYG